MRLDFTVRKRQRLLTVAKACDVAPGTSELQSLKQTCLQFQPNMKEHRHCEPAESGTIAQTDLEPVPVTASEAWQSMQPGSRLRSLFSFNPFEALSHG
jgi:hypothetical protein